MSNQHRQELDKAQTRQQTLTNDLDGYQRLVTEREQQLQILRDSLSSSLTELIERLNSAEAEDTNNSSDVAILLPVRYDFRAKNSPQQAVTILRSLWNRYSLTSGSKSIDFSDLQQSLSAVTNSLKAIPSASATLVTQVRHTEEQLALQAQHLQDLAKAGNSLQTKYDSSRAEVLACQKSLSAEVAQKSLLAGKLEALEAKYDALQEKHHRSNYEKGKLNDRVAHLERSEQAQKEAQQQCQDELSTVKQQLEEERKKIKLCNPFKLFNSLNESKDNTTQKS
ncbi:MAG: hypothetical protein F6K04_03195 [Leptolyngbya sp. SIO4C5]|nr:hypothetical protein [Leptolyngbya sp. SIO4C5]